MNGIAVGSVITRFLPTQGLCPHCNIGSETVDHALVDCVFAKEVWACYEGEGGIRKEGFSLAANFAGLLKSNIEGSRLGCFVIWQLWKSRNARVYSEGHAQPKFV